MAGQKFSDLFMAQYEFGEDSIKLMLTKMNYEEISRHFNSELNSASKMFNGSVSKFDKISKLYKFPNIVEIKTKIREHFDNELKGNFDIYNPTNNLVYERAIQRYYEKKMPFRENKQEFKDAIIWETIYDYALNNGHERVYIISDNYKDYSNSDMENLRLHQDFDDLDGRIIYKRSINDLLEEIDYLKLNYFEYMGEENKNAILSNINIYLEEYLGDNPNLDYELDDWFSNFNFMSEYFEGWGSNPYVEKLEDVKFNEIETVYEKDDYFYIPIEFDALISFNVETRNPVYERGDDDEFLISESMTRSVRFTATIHYDKVNNVTDKIVEITPIDFN